MRLSVVIPTLNEADSVPGAVASVHAEGGPRGMGDVEVVVSDSGSSDATLTVAHQWCSGGDSQPTPRTLEAPPGGLPHRAAACNQGAAVARGEILLFLDADARLPTDWRRRVAVALAEPGVVGGAFHLRLDGPQPGLRWVERLNRWRYRRSHLFYGDQGLFVRADIFRRAGGFPDRPVLESAFLCRRLKALGHLVLVDAAVTASARRFQDGGIARVFATDLALWLRFLLRLGPGATGQRYWDWNRRRGDARSHLADSLADP